METEPVTGETSEALGTPVTLDEPATGETSEALGVPEEEQVEGIAVMRATLSET